MAECWEGGRIPPRGLCRLRFLRDIANETGLACRPFPRNLRHLDGLFRQRRIIWQTTESETEAASEHPREITLTILGSVGQDANILPKDKNLPNEEGQRNTAAPLALLNAVRLPPYLRWTYSLGAMA